MSTNEAEIIAFMKSVKDRYFPELEISTFEVVHDTSFEGVMGRARFGGHPKVVLHYSDKRILAPRYRAGLIPIISHELAHFINPIDPEKVMRDRLPAPIIFLWEQLLSEGYAKCSLENERSKA